MLKWNLDNLEIAVVSGGRMRIDGGAMFGVVPRAVWARAVPPDEAHRIQLDTNCLLIRAGRPLRHRRYGVRQQGIGSGSPQFCLGGGRALGPEPCSPGGGAGRG